jgi:hypothetical protein
MPLPISGKIDALATLHSQRRHAAHLIAIRNAAVTGITMAQRKPVMRQQGKPRKKGTPLKAPKRSAFFPVVTSNLLNMICVTTVFGTVLAVLLGVAKWT